jgi:hypothetical protein
MQTFDPDILSDEDRDIAFDIVDGANRSLACPDLVIAPDRGEPYLYRWHILRDKAVASVYFHIQTRSDPERPLHDHPWDNTSIILSGGYDEIYDPRPDMPNIGLGAFRGSSMLRSAVRPLAPMERSLRKGDSVFRPAVLAHRLLLPDGVPYSMSLFVTGPVKREWGFWYPDGFHSYLRHVADRDGQSVHVHEEKTND